MTPGSRNLGDALIVKSHLTKVTVLVPRGVIKSYTMSAVSLVVEVLPAVETVAMRILEHELIGSHVGINTCVLAILHAVEDIEIEIRLEGEAINKKNELIKQEKNNEILGCNCKNNFNSRKTDDKLENNDKNMETLSDNKKTARDLLREAIEKRYKELKEKGSIDESDSDDSF